MNEIKASINRNGLLSKKITSKYFTDTIDFNEHDINIFHKWQVEKICGRRHRATLQNYKATSLPESPSNMSPAAYPSGAPELPPDFSWVHVTRSSVLCVCFVDHCLSFFFWPLCCLFFFDIQILITPIVSSP